jgi:hypothetical protein
MTDGHARAISTVGVAHIQQEFVMSNRRTGILVFLSGLVVMALSLIMGKVLQLRLHELGMNGLQQVHGMTGMVPAFVFFFAFPVGLVICLMGAVSMRRSLTGRVWAYALLAIPAVAITVLVPAMFGKEMSTDYFGAGGISIMLLAAATIYYWGSYRARQPASHHSALDLQAIGYLCFALAAWNTCGFGGPPSFGLYPEKMIALDAHELAIGQLKSIMAFFVIGWLFTMLGFLKAARATRRDK